MKVERPENCNFLQEDACPGEDRHGECHLKNDIPFPMFTKMNSTEQVQQTGLNNQYNVGREAKKRISDDSWVSGLSDLVASVWWVRSKEVAFSIQ